jgi:hypothetical protein
LRLALILLCALGATAASAAAPDPLSHLYQPARIIQISPTEIVCEADSFQYRFDRVAETWDVVKRKRPFDFPPPGDGDDRYDDDQRQAQYRFITDVRDNEVRLEIVREQDGDEDRLADLELYDRSMTGEAWYPVEEDHFKSEAGFTDTLEHSRPRVTDVTDDGRFLWVTLAYSVREGNYGIGTLVRVDAITGEVKIFQPALLSTSSLSHVATAAYAAWIGTVHHGELGEYPTLGLVRFDPVSGEVKSHLPSSSRILGRIVTALAADGDTLWIGTDEGICRYRIRQREWTCWRIQPGVRILAHVPVSNRPGGEATRRIHRGHYELRWATRDSLEVVTRDALEGWIQLGPREELPLHDHYREVHGLVERGDPPPAAVLVFVEPGGTIGEAAVMERIQLQKLPLRTADGWQKVRARAGWIPRPGLQLKPQIVLIEEDD